MNILIDEVTQQTMAELEKTQHQFWNISRVTAEFLYALIRTQKSKNVLEIGTSNGYSGLWITKALKQTGGKYTTIEYYDKRESKDELKEYLKVLKKVDSKKYNILLLHSPINLIENKKISLDCFKNYDLILCGHMHSGLIPKVFRKKIGMGLVGPHNNFFPKYSIR